MNDRAGNYRGEHITVRLFTGGLLKGHIGNIHRAKMKSPGDC